MDGLHGARHRYRHDLFTAKENLLNVTRAMIELCRRSLFGRGFRAHGVRFFDVGQDHVCEFIKSLDVCRGHPSNASRVSRDDRHSSAPLSRVSEHAERPLSGVFRIRETVEHSLAAGESLALLDKLFRALSRSSLRGERARVPPETYTARRCFPSAVRRALARRR